MNDCPVPPRPMCVDGGGTREEWNEYHICAALYYDNMSLSIEDVKHITGQKGNSNG